MRFLYPSLFVGAVQRPNVLSIYPLCFHPLPHSLRAMEIHNPFPINHFRTLSHSMEGEG